MLVLAATVELLAFRSKAGNRRPHCKTRFTDYPVCWDADVDIEIILKGMLSRVNEMCREFQRAGGY